jgi:hypothetical protein
MVTPASQRGEWNDQSRKQSGHFGWYDAYLMDISCFKI